MKIKNDFVLRRVADAYVVVPMGQAMINFDGMITLNESGAMLWRLMEQETSKEALANALTSEYDVSDEEALRDVEAFLSTLEKANCLEK